VFGHPSEHGRYSFAVCAERPGAIGTTTNFELQVDAGLAALKAADTVIVPGFLPRTDPPPAVLEALQRVSARGARIASICIGAFALAAAGLLDARTATTHWEHAGELARRFPRVRVRSDVLYVDEGQVLTSAGVAAGIDLCLYMVQRDFGAAAAVEVSRRMVAAVHRPGGQAQFITRPLPEMGSGLAPTCAWAIAQRCGLGTAANLRLHLARDAGDHPDWLPHRIPRTLSRSEVIWTDMPDGP